MISSFSAAENLDMQTVVTDVFYHLHLSMATFPRWGTEQQHCYKCMWGCSITCRPKWKKGSSNLHKMMSKEYTAKMKNSDSFAGRWHRAV